MAEGLIIRDRQQTNPAHVCFVVVVPVSTQGEVHFDIRGSTWGERIAAYLFNFLPLTHTQKH